MVVVVVVAVVVVVVVVVFVVVALGCCCWLLLWLLLFFFLLLLLLLVLLLLLLVVVVVLGCCCCCSLGPFVTAHRIMFFLLFPLFFAVFSLFHCAKNAGFFALLFWVGVWGFGGGGFPGGGWGVSGGGGWGGGIIAFVCVCCRFALPFFFITVVSFFFSLRQDVNFFVWRVWFCYCPCCLDRVRDLWFFGGWVLRDLGLCVLYMI